MMIKVHRFIGTTFSPDGILPRCSAHQFANVVLQTMKDSNKIELSKVVVADKISAFSTSLSPSHPCAHSIIVTQKVLVTMNHLSPKVAEIVVFAQGNPNLFSRLVSVELNKKNP